MQLVIILVFSLEIIGGVANLAYRIVAMWYDVIKTNNIEREDMKLTIFLDGFTSIKIARDYLEKFNRDYEKTFDTYLKDGTINFVDEKDDNIYEPKVSFAGADIIDDNVRKNINVALGHNYADPGTIVHEFFHLQNLQEKISDSRYSLTELISIYFEDNLLKYMKDLGYDQKEIAKVCLLRQYDTFECSKEYLEFIDLFNAFNQLGNIREDTFAKKDDIAAIHLPDDSEIWDDKLAIFNASIKNNKPIRGLILSRYIFCDPIAKYLNKDNSKELENKMLNFNDLINETDIGSCLDSVGVSLRDSEINDKLLFTYKETLKRNCDNLKSVEKLNK